MSDRILQRAGAASGLVYVVVLFGGSVLPGEVAKRVEIVGMLFFLPFLGYLCSVLRRAEGEPGWLATTALGAGVVDLTIKLGSIAPAVAARKAGEGTRIHDALTDVNGASFIATMLPLSVLAASVAVLTFRTGVLPRWLGWLATVTALALLVNGLFLNSDFGPAFLLFLLWTAATSVVLTRRAGVRRTAIVSPRPAAGLAA
jgi:hypothetical protein